MTERLADISARIDGIRQLDSVVNAMKGIAASRARIAHKQLSAVDSYAASVAVAMSSAIGPDTQRNESTITTDPEKSGLLVFCAEQGFAGAFSERVLDSLDNNPGAETVFLIGTRGLSVAKAQGLIPGWHAALPSHTLGIPKLADTITQVIYQHVNEGHVDHLDVLFTRWKSGRPAMVRQVLFPIDMSDLPMARGERPLMQMPLEILTDLLGRDYFHALICKAALHAFAAENQARMEAMSAASTQITHELKTFEATLRRVRQEAITAEIIELGTGAASQLSCDGCSVATKGTQSGHTSIYLDKTTPNPQKY